MMLVTVETLATSEKEFSSSASEECSKDVIRVKLILSELLIISLRKILFGSMLIIDLSLLRVA